MLSIIKNLFAPTFTIFVLLLNMQLSHADDFGFLDLRELSVDAKSYYPGGHYPLITDNKIPGGRSLDKELNLSIKTDMLKYFYWDSTVHSMTDKTLDGYHGQFRLIGLEFGVGLRISSSVEFGYYHYSEHLMDASLPWHFPVRDALQLKVFLYRTKGERDSLF